MALRLVDKWIWDFWLVESEGIHHIFYLQAPKAIGNPGLRHWNVSIGHATSRDLIDWEILPDALGPGNPRRWDDLSTWTGSIIEHHGLWHLFYTGTSTAEEGLVQRIGLAVSDDLVRWQRHGDRALIAADPRWYETIESEQWHDEAWRDPWVFRHTDGWFHATITARTNDGPTQGRGVVAHARSGNLLEWEVLAPITEPDGFGQVEVSQVLPYGDSWYMLFCSDIHSQSDQRREHGPGTGTYYLRSASPFGPYQLTEARTLSVDRLGSSYAGRLVDLGESGLYFLAWEWRDSNSEFVGAISDPVAVNVTDNGELRLAGRP